MNSPRVAPEEDIPFPLATPKASTCTEAARVHPAGPAGPAHDACTRLLHRLEPDPAMSWAEVAPLIDRAAGVLGVDDTTLDKPHARKVELVTRHGSGKHRLDRGPPTRLDERAVAAPGTVVWLPGYGSLKVFRSVARDGGAEYGVTNDSDLDDPGREALAGRAWAVETYHRGLKQDTGVGRCPVRPARAPRSHIGFAIRARVRRECHRFVEGGVGSRPRGASFAAP